MLKIVLEESYTPDNYVKVKHKFSRLNCCYRSIGYEYELILRERLQNRGIPFLGENGFVLKLVRIVCFNTFSVFHFHLKGEDDMRSRGYDKTPDCKLEIPIGNLFVILQRYLKI